uniref:Uncharacterized protein n=1 Tax=Amphimedon queenslandica TaxID=400682 RepID=A0A1X7T3K4_AMPQE
MAVRKILDEINNVYSVLTEINSRLTSIEDDISFLLSESSQKDTDDSTPSDKGSATNVASGATTGSQTTSSVTMPTKRPFKPRGTVPPVAIKKKAKAKTGMTLT